ncbi:MAG: rhodanese [Methylococcaceae bacterium]|nr:rhodanese [Methylococcaceae bacterium]
MSFQRIPVAEARRILQSERPLLLDVRDANAYGASRIANATHLTSRDVMALMRKTPRETPVLVYCYHGNASQDMARLFADFGFARVYSVDGGFALWSKEFPGDAELPGKPAGVDSIELRDWLSANGFDTIGIRGINRDGATALIQACRQANADLAEQLLGLGLPLDGVDAHGNDALWAACYGGDLATIAVLLEAGVDLDRRNPDGSTALMYAASAGKAEIVCFLLEAGADPFLRNRDDFTALDLAADAASLKVLRNWRPRAGSDVHATTDQE